MDFVFVLLGLTGILGRELITGWTEAKKAGMIMVSSGDSENMLKMEYYASIF